MRVRAGTRRTALPALAAAVLWLGAGPAASHEGGSGNEMMWQVCETARVDDPCAFQNDAHDTYRGSCQAMAGDLVCVRNQPIERAVTPAEDHTHHTPETAGAGPSPWLGAGLFALISGGLLWLGWRMLRRARRKRRPSRDL